MKQLIASLTIVFGLLIAVVSPASACGTGGTTTMYKHCDKWYRGNWDAGKFGNGGAMDPRGWHGGRRVAHGQRPIGIYGAGNHYNGRVAHGHYGRPMMVVGGAVGGATFAQRYYAQFEQTRGLPPSPEAVYERQLATGNVTKTRIPCADGFDTLPNGNCGRWVPN